MRILGVALVVLCGLAWGCGGNSANKPSDLTVAATPTGEIKGQLKVVLTFSKPMVAGERVGKPDPAAPLGIAPAIPGEAMWQDDRTLTFVPTTNLPVSTKYVVTVPAGTKALDGHQLTSPVAFEMFTERLAATIDVVGSKDRATKDQIVKIAFNQEVAFDQVAQHCGFVGGGQQRKLKLAPESSPGPARMYSVQPVADLTLDAAWKVECKPAIKGIVGNLGLDKAAVHEFKTHGPLRFVSLEPNGNDIVPDENLRLALAFTNPLAAPYAIKISPAVLGFSARCHSLGNQPAGLSCAAQLDPLTSYTITIDKAQKDIFGQTLDKPHTLSFRTTDSKPTISLESGYFVAELKRPVIPLWTRNVTKLDVTAVQITPASFHELQPVLQWWETAPADFTKTRLKPKRKQFAVTGQKNKWGQQSLGAGAVAAELFGATPGPGMYYVEVGSPEVQKGVYKDNGRAKILVNFTDIGVVSKLSPTRGLVWATQLSTGKPLANAQVSVRDAKGKVTFTGTTDGDGVAYLPGTDKLDGGPAGTPTEDEGFGDDEYDGGMRIYVANGADWTMVNPTRTGGLSPWSFNVSQDYDRAPTRLRGFMHTDRGLYRPGDKVHVKGFARVAKLGEPLSPPGAGKTVEVEVRGPQGRTVMTTEAKTSAFGGFWFDLELPGDARLGDYYIHAKLEHGSFTREFSVEEYRAATFEVSGKLAQKLVLRRGTLNATVSASYLYGAPLRGGDAEVTVHARPRHVHFAQHAGFEFGDDRTSDRYYYGDSDYGQSLVSSESVTLDQSGNAKLAINVSPDDVYKDSDLIIRANVTAPNNETIGKSFTVPYYRSKRYFGIRSPEWFIDVKKPYKLQVISVGPDGKVLDGTSKVTVTRRDWNCVWEDWGYNGSYHCTDETKKILEKSVAITGGRPADVELTAPEGGDYMVVVEAEGADKAESAPAGMRLYAWGDGGGSWRTDDTLAFDIVADKKEYKAGDTAKLVLKTDLSQATGLVSIERDGVIEKRIVQITPTQKHVEIPVTANHAPNVYVSVALVQGRMGDGPRGKPRMRMGIVNLPVRPDDNKLKVTIETDKKDYRPGATVKATVKVTDGAGKPVAGEVSISAADEGVLSLIGFETPDPIPTFWAPWGIGVTSATQLEYLRDIPAPNLERPATGGDGAAPGTLRSRFAATAVWTPNALTNAAGVATITFKAPDNLTAFRVMAVAADRGYRFGSGDLRFTVSKPLQLHQALPRFVNQGDTIKAGVVVHNETPGAGTATVKLVTDDGLTVAGGNERTIQLAKGARVPVLFDLTGARLGTTALQFSVAMNGESDAVKWELPVQHPSPQKTQHVGHAAIKDPVTVQLPIPASTLAGTAEVAVSVDPDGLSGIEDGLEDLVRYPYGCLEQTTSKVIPMLAVRDLAESMAIDGLTGAKLDGFVKAGLAKIGRHQTAYGGFSLWPGGEPEQYYSAYALWGLHIAKQAGYVVDETRIEEALDYLRGDGKRPDKSTPYYDEEGDLGSQAFAVYVRAMFKDKDAGPSATTLLANAKLPVYGKAFAVRALAASVGAKDPAVQKAVAELGAAASAAAKADKLVDEPEDLYYYMSSDLRTTAIVLHTLVELDPKHEAIKPLVRVIMNKRRSERYLDTQSNMYSLLALTSYAKQVAGAAPSVTVELGGTKLFEGALTGKTRIRTATVAIPAGAALAIKPRGEVHYNVDIRYRVEPAAIKAENNGIELRREYLDESGKPKTAFTVGDVVLVRVTATHKDRVNHLMISEPIPAGFEPLNTKLATVAVPTTSTQQRTYWGTFRELRDSRVDFASEYRWNGTHVYEFAMRATTVGKFARPPTVGELMYQPAVNGQTAMDTIEVRAK